LSELLTLLFVFGVAPADERFGEGAVTGGEEIFEAEFLEFE
jgi:hypothetical protein